MSDNKLALVSHPLCPFVQRAAIVLLEKGVPFDRLDIDLAAKPDWFLAISPTGKVPVLKIDQPDGSTAVLFESMAICEYLEESYGDKRLYPANTLTRARHRGWIEVGTAALADAWQFLNAKDSANAEAKQEAFRGKLQQLETVLGDGAYFDGGNLGMVDAVYAPVFRYFDIIDPKVSQHIFTGLPRVTAWRVTLAANASVKNAVAKDYSERFLQHLRVHSALLAA